MTSFVTPLAQSAVIDGPPDRLFVIPVYPVLFVIVAVGAVIWWVTARRLRDDDEE